MSENRETQAAQDNPGFDFTGGRFSGLVPTDAEVIQVGALGGGLVIEADRKVDFSVDLAERLLGLQQIEGERPLRDRHVSYLISSMKRGTFRYEMVRLATCALGGIEYRMNGQHTCWARVSMPADWEPAAKVSLVKYVAQTPQDMRLLYTSIDRGAPRTKANVVTAHLVGCEQFEGLSTTVIRHLAEGYAWYKWDAPHLRSRYDGDDVAYLMQSEDANLVNSVIAYLSTFQLGSYDFLRRAAVLAAMFFCFAKSVRAAGEFWDAVREGVGLTSKNDPRLRLRNALMMVKIGSDKGRGRSASRGKGAGSEEVLRWCLAAWNAWRRNEELTVLRAVLSAPRPAAR